MTSPGPTPSADELRADIERTRAELGDTVDALAERLDVKAQLRRRLDTARARLTSDPRRTAAGALALVAGTVAWVMWRRSR